MKRSTFFAPDHLKVWPTQSSDGPRSAFNFRPIPLEMTRTCCMFLSHLGDNIFFSIGTDILNRIQFKLAIIESLFFFRSPFKRPPIEVSPLPSANQLSENEI